MAGFAGYPNGPSKPRSTPAEDLRLMARMLRDGVPEVLDFALGLAPGSGEVMAAQDSIEAGGQMGEAIRRGEIGAATSRGAEAITASLGAVPLLGLGVRGVRTATRELADMLRSTKRAEEAAEKMGKSAGGVGIAQDAADALGLSEIPPEVLALIEAWR